MLITREVDESKGDAEAVEPTTRGAGFLLRPVMFEDARVREALSRLDVAVLELLVAYQRSWGRPNGDDGGVTVPLSTLATDKRVRAKVGRTPTERQVRASLGRLRRYGLERVVRQRYVMARTPEGPKDRTPTIRVTVREALPGVDVPDDAPAVHVPWSQLAHDEAERDLARPGRGRKGITRPEWAGPTTRTDRGTWAPCVAAPASPSVAAPARVEAPNVVAPVTMRHGSSASNAESEQRREVGSAAPYVAAPYLLSPNQTDSLSEDGETRGARQLSSSEAKHPDHCPECLGLRRASDEQTAGCECASDVDRSTPGGGPPLRSDVSHAGAPVAGDRLARTSTHDSVSDVDPLASGASPHVPDGPGWLPSGSTSQTEQPPTSGVAASPTPTGEVIAPVGAGPSPPRPGDVATREAESNKREHE